MTKQGREGEKRSGKKPGEYEVGYGRPPKASQFTKGGSGNRSGRPKKPKSFVEALAEAMSREVVVRVGGKRVRRTLRELTAHQIATRAAEGDIKAIKLAANLDPHFAPLAEEEEEFSFTLLFEEEEQRRSEGGAM